MEYYGDEDVTGDVLTPEAFFFYSASALIERYCTFLLFVLIECLLDRAFQLKISDAIFLNKLLFGDSVSCASNKTQ